MQESNVKPTPALLALAAAREALVVATEKAEAAHSAQSKLLVRKSEAEAVAAGALADFRSGKIDEATASLRRASAEADAQDLAALIEQGSATLQRLNVDAAGAAATCREAEGAAKTEEFDIALTQLKLQAMQAELALVATLAELGRVNRLRNPVGQSSLSLFNVWSATPALKEAVNRHIVPTVAA
jgi:hypothetical protein